jgi:hypothetical protein
MINDFLVDVKNRLIKSVELFFIDIRGNMGFFSFLLLKFFHFAIFFSFKSFSLLSIFKSLGVFSFLFLLLLKFFDDFVEALFRSGFFYFKPVNHDSILQFQS